jgi:hypothetical protein
MSDCGSCRLESCVARLGFWPEPHDGTDSVVHRWAAVRQPANGHRHDRQPSSHGPRRNLHRCDPKTGAGVSSSNGQRRHRIAFGPRCRSFEPGWPGSRAPSPRRDGSVPDLPGPLADLSLRFGARRRFVRVAGVRRVRSGSLPPLRNPGPWLRSGEVPRLRLVPCRWVFVSAPRFARAVLDVECATSRRRWPIA